MRRTAFTLIELLVVVAIIALLISILLPSLQGAREQGKRAACLSNMKAIALGCHMYAEEDKGENVIPIHFMYRSTQARSRWTWRMGEWFIWGGRSAPETITGMLPMGETGNYDAKRRPLNRYMYSSLGEGDAANLPVFKCPSDTGYPDDAPYTPPAPNGIDDAPPSAAGRPCYDITGNSYRASLYSYLSDTFAFAIGPWGKPLSKLPNVSRLIVYGEPTFFNMIGLDNGQATPDPVIAMGWHKKRMTDNIVYADGSARSTGAAGREPLGPDATNLMGLTGLNATLTSRGPSWQFDTWPVPGALIRGSAATVNGLGLNANQWPVAGFTRLQ
jgi:prepilin-type N-terminal cleavage/methylation domain-containing protein